MEYKIKHNKTRQKTHQLQLVYLPNILILVMKQNMEIPCHTITTTTTTTTNKTSVKIKRSWMKPLNQWYNSLNMIFWGFFFFLFSSTSTDQNIKEILLYFIIYLYFCSVPSSRTHTHPRKWELNC
ncbi:Hypothetical predicted protein [Octopus vulgaris]|uniref:Uncharacterized protein n=1 Tax=Octopus vulgaris TaxID=6645 RepID=A0AA36BVM1_OCTVU|nr:Hypothetical predicted protein [Octopus vulgaris]